MEASSITTLLVTEGVILLECSKSNMSFDFIKHVLVVVFARGLGAISMFLLNFVVAYTMPLKEAGVFFFSLTILMVLAPISLLGLQQTAVKIVGASFEQNDWSKINSF